MKNGDTRKGPATRRGSTEVDAAIGLDCTPFTYGVLEKYAQAPSQLDAAETPRDRPLLAPISGLRTNHQRIDSDTKGYEAIARAMVALLEESRRDKPTMLVAELNRNGSRLLYS
jgi:hypothetical protein